MAETDFLHENKHSLLKEQFIRPRGASRFWRWLRGSCPKKWWETLVYHKQWKRLGWFCFM